MNCILKPINYSDRHVRATAVYMGVSFIASEDESRVRRAFYPVRATSGSFGSQFAFKSWAELNSFVAWLRGYLDRIANPHSVNVGPISFILPSRNLVKVGVPKGGVIYEDRFDSLTYYVNLQWLGTSDPIGDIGKTDGLASFFTKSPNNPQSKWFYPTTIPLDGSDAYSQAPEAGLIENEAPASHLNPVGDEYVTQIYKRDGEPNLYRETGG